MNKLLVTGSGGFVGKFLLPLINNFDEVLRFSGDLRNIKDVEKNVDENVVVIVNLASKIYGSDDEIKSVNIDGLSNLLKVLRRKAPRLERFVHIGSAAEYGFSDYPISESVLAKPMGVYGQTKLKQTTMVLDEFANTDVNAIVLRLFNVVGKNMKENMLFAKIKSQIDREDDKQIVISNRKSTRDWIDVRDVAKLINDFVNIRKAPDSGIYNIGRGIAVTNEEVIIAFENYLGIKVNVVETVSDFDSSVADISKLKRLFPAWKNSYDLADMIKGLYE